MFLQRIQRLYYLLAFDVSWVEFCDFETIVEENGQLAKVATIVEYSKQFLEASSVQSYVWIPARLDNEGEVMDTAKERFAVTDFA
jgi:hypothetical protein